jgi:hypothetical protein
MNVFTAPFVQKTVIVLPLTFGPLNVTAPGAGVGVGEGDGDAIGVELDAFPPDPLHWARVTPSAARARKPKI